MEESIILEVFGWYASFSVAAGVMLLLWAYGYEWRIQFYERFVPGSKWPVDVICARTSPERGKFWVAWVAAGAIGIPVLNAIVAVVWIYGYIKHRAEEREMHALAVDRERRHESIRRDVAEYHRSRTNGRSF